MTTSMVDVRLHEVGPRDGLQAEATPIPTRDKVKFCLDLIAAGVTSLEVGAFVSPRRVPQMADSEEVARELIGIPGITTTALVPNQRGLDAAARVSIDQAAVLASATESFAQRNLSSSKTAALDNAKQVAAQAVDWGMAARGYVSMCFGDPWEGTVDTNSVVETCRELVDAGCATVVVSDTIGVATPPQVVALLEALSSAGMSSDHVALHMHDTYGQALANVWAGIAYGVREIDASAGGLGRCPFAPGATGNLATEDALWMLHAIGAAKGISIRAVSEATEPILAMLQRATSSSVAIAMKPKETEGADNDV